MIFLGCIPIVRPRRIFERKKNSLIEIKNYDTAIEVLRYMIKNEDSVEFAKSELKYVLQLKKENRKRKAEAG